MFLFFNSEKRFSNTTHHFKHVSFSIWRVTKSPSEIAPVLTKLKSDAVCNSTAVNDDVRVHNAVEPSG